MALAAAVLVLFWWLRVGVLFGASLPPPKFADDWVKVLGFTLGIPAGVLTLFTYVRSVSEQQRANLWKRVEFVAERFDLIEASPLCKAAMRMLDYNATHLELDELKGLVVNDRLVMAALAPHQLRGSYTVEEQIIRDAFDAWLSALDRLAAMTSAGLIETEDLAPFADYWLALFNPSARERPLAYGAVLRRYIRVFHFDALATLLRTKGLMASGSTAERQAVDDDAEIAKFDSSWIAPAEPAWEALTERVEAAS